MTSASVGSCPSRQIGCAVEVRGGHQVRRVLAGIEAAARRVAVGVDDVAMKRGAHRRGIRQQPFVKRVEVPVGVREQAAVVVEPLPDGRRHAGARVRESQDHRRRRRARLRRRSRPCLQPRQNSACDRGIERPGGHQIGRRLQVRSPCSGLPPASARRRGSRPAPAATAGWWSAARAVPRPAPRSAPRCR